MNVGFRLLIFFRKRRRGCKKFRKHGESGTKRRRRRKKETEIETKIETKIAKKGKTTIGYSVVTTRGLYVLYMSMLLLPLVFMTDSCDSNSF